MCACPKYAPIYSLMLCGMQVEGSRTKGGCAHPPAKRPHKDIGDDCLDLCALQHSPGLHEAVQR